MDCDTAQNIFVHYSTHFPDVYSVPTRRSSDLEAARKVLDCIRGAKERKAALREVDSDLEQNILVHTPIPWTDAFREAENIGAAHTERLGVRSFHLLHVGLTKRVGPRNRRVDQN